MSTENGEKLKRNEAMIGSNDDDVAPPAKRLKGAPSKRQPCLLLDFGPEIMRNIFSFLLLKDGLEVYRTCRQLRTDEIVNSIFRYCFIMDYVNAEHKYVKAQNCILCNPVNLDNLRSVLKNETLSTDFSGKFIQQMTIHATTDNAPAMEALLQDGRFKTTNFDLDWLLQKGFTGMAAKLLEVEHIKAASQLCGTCQSNVACYDCTHDYFDSIRICMKSSFSIRYCRQCVEIDDRFCSHCEDYICSECNNRQSFKTCEKCSAIGCYHNDCFVYFPECVDCNRVKCLACRESDGEDWNDFDEYRCPSCQDDASDSSHSI